MKRNCTTLKNSILSIAAFFLLFDCFQAIAQKVESFSPTRADTLIKRAKKIQTIYPDSALALCQLAFEDSKAKNDLTTATKALMSKGLAYCNLGRYAKSLETYATVYPLSKKIGSSSTSLLYNNIGLVYYNQGVYATAAYYYQLAIKEMEQEVHPSSMILITYSNLAAIFAQFGQYEQALRYLLQAEFLGRRERYEDDGLGYALVNIGCVYVVQNKLKQAQPYLIEAISIGKKYNNPDLVQTASVNLGDILIREKKPDQAIGYLKALIAAGGGNNLITSTINPRYALSNAYFELGRYEEAEATIVPALEIASKLGISEGRANAHQQLAKIYEAEGKYEVALKQERLYRTLRDSQLNLEKSKAINDLELKYRTAQKDKEITENKLMITQQNSKLLRKNTIIWGIALGVLILAGTSWQRYRHDKKLQGQKIQGLEQERELLEQRQELNAMQSMISGEEKERKRIGRELHDGIGGLLSVVRIRFSSLKKKHEELREEEDFKEIVELLDEATAEVRKTAHNLMPETLLRAGLTEAVRIFCERVRRGNDLSIQVESYGEAMRLEPFLELSLYRIIQELVQNIIKHSKAEIAQVQFNWKEEQFAQLQNPASGGTGGSIAQTHRESQEISGGKLIIMVEDNGMGFQPEKEAQGIGLENTLARVKALQGQMHIDSAAGSGTTIWLEFSTELLERQVV
jgi:signal transduction histidine kinase